MLGCAGARTFREVGPQRMRGALGDRGPLRCGGWQRDLQIRAAVVVRQRPLAQEDGAARRPLTGETCRLQAEEEGLDKIFKDFGADWRFAGCSMCLGMNPDQLAPGERAASTSNRNFEGRQGKGARTHLVSPVVAAATAVRGTLSSPSDIGMTDYIIAPN